MPRDNSPVRNTCPDIDEAQTQAQSAADCMHDAREYLKDFIKKLELLREENAELRAWGNEQYSRADQAESDLSASKKEIIDLESELKYLKQDISNLEMQLNQSEIQSV